MAQIKKVTPYSIRATYITLVKGEKIDGNLLLTVPEADANKKSNDYIWRRMSIEPEGWRLPALYKTDG